jgi:hypothetical protein
MVEKGAEVCVGSACAALRLALIADGISCGRRSAAALTGSAMGQQPEEGAPAFHVTGFRLGDDRPHDLFGVGGNYLLQFGDDARCCALLTPLRVTAFVFVEWYCSCCF